MNCTACQKKVWGALIHTQCGCELLGSSLDRPKNEVSIQLVQHQVTITAEPHRVVIHGTTHSIERDVTSLLLWPSKSALGTWNKRLMDVTAEKLLLLSICIFIHIHCWCKLELALKNALREWLTFWICCLPDCTTLFITWKHTHGKLGSFTANLSCRASSSFHTVTVSVLRLQPANFHTDRNQYDHRKVCHHIQCHCHRNHYQAQTPR